MKTQNVPNVVTIGGGTGAFVVLSGLKNYNINLSAVVTMMDSGGSTGRLRDQLGVLPPGDLRQALVALSESKEIWRKLFTYRFDKGDLSGHNFGNIFLSALEKITGSIGESINLANELLQTQGNVYPVTFSDCRLCAKYTDGTVVEGESNIEEMKNKDSKIDYMYLAPSAVLNLEAKRALERADYIIFGPGDLYTSILPNLVVDGMSQVMCYSKAKKILVCNIMTRKGQTDDFKVSDFVAELEKYLGGSLLDFVVINNKVPEPDLLKYYHDFDEASLVNDDTFGSYYENRKVIRGDFLSSAKLVQSSADRIKRSLIRHDGEKLAEALLNIMR